MRAEELQTGFGLTGTADRVKGAGAGIDGVCGVTVGTDRVKGGRAGIDGVCGVTV
jgi:hypothetical protein